MSIRLKKFDWEKLFSFFNNALQAPLYFILTPITPVFIALFIPVLLIPFVWILSIICAVGALGELFKKEYDIALMFAVVLSMLIPIWVSTAYLPLTMTITSGILFAISLAFL